MQSTWRDLPPFLTRGLVLVMEHNARGAWLLYGLSISAPTHLLLFRSILLCGRVSKLDKNREFSQVRTTSGCGGTPSLLTPRTWKYVDSTR